MYVNAIVLAVLILHCVNVYFLCADVAVLTCMLPLFLRSRSCMCANVVVLVVVVFYAYIHISLLLA